MQRVRATWIWGGGLLLCAGAFILAKPDALQMAGVIAFIVVVYLGRRGYVRLANEFETGDGPPRRRCFRSYRLCLTVVIVLMAAGLGGLMTNWEAYQHYITIGALTTVWLLGIWLLDIRRRRT